MSIAVDCSSKGRAICQRCHRKGGSMSERSWAFSVSPTHTHTFELFTFCSGSRHRLSSDWPIISSEVCRKVPFRQRQTGETAPETKLSDALLSCRAACCYDVALITGQTEQTFGRDREWKSDLWEMCSCGFSIWIFGDLFHGNYQSYEMYICSLTALLLLLLSE